jgi:hypothetical protein
VFGWPGLSPPQLHSGQLPAGMYRARIVWHRTDLRATREAAWRGETYRLRFNDYPREPLCTLTAGEVVVAELDELPIRWSLD